MNIPEKLIDFAAEVAKKRRMSLLRLDTSAHQEKLRQIYQDLGFSLAGIADEETRQTAFYQRKI